MKSSVWVGLSALICSPLILASLAIGIVAAWVWLAVGKGFDMVINGGPK